MNLIRYYSFNLGEAQTIAVFWPDRKFYGPSLHLNESDEPGSFQS